MFLGRPLQSITDCRRSSEILTAFWYFKNTQNNDIHSYCKNLINSLKTLHLLNSCNRSMSDVGLKKNDRHCLVPCSSSLCPKILYVAASSPFSIDTNPKGVAHLWRVQLTKQGKGGVRLELFCAKIIYGVLQNFKSSFWWVFFICANSSWLLFGQQIHSMLRCALLGSIGLLFCAVLSCYDLFVISCSILCFAVTSCSSPFCAVLECDLECCSVLCCFV